MGGAEQLQSTSDWPVSGSVGGTVGGAYNVPPTPQDTVTFTPVANPTLGE